ncbi:MAG: aldo/keto reductase [Oscillospiraceae bacterium]|nr:aldo/keto reductase [Oscillospiraceae bacterium]
MIYREFGKTGEKISALGYGCMRLPELERDGVWTVDYDRSDEMLLTAYEQGVNYFDTAPAYCHGNSEIAVGRGLKAVRDQVLISTKVSMDHISSAADYRRALEESLKKLDTDYIDFYHFWALNREAFDGVVMRYDLLDAARKAKEEGLIRHISFSFHDAPEVIRHIIDTAEAYGVPMESMLVQYNLLDRSNEEMLSYAHQKGLGTIAMGPVGGGRLAAPTDLYQKLTGKPSIATYELAFRFVLGNPDLCCALSGMSDVDMVRKNAALASDDRSFSKAEWEMLGESLEQLKKFSELYCTGCGYCQPCPAEINIPHIFQQYTYYNVYGLKEHAKNGMARYLSEGGKTLRDCQGCGLCEQKCPQKLKIRKHLKQVEDLLTEK